METNFVTFANEFWYIALSFAALLGFGFGCVFWWLVLKD